MEFNTYDTEDDGSVYTEINGRKQQFRLGEPVYQCSKIETFVIKCSSYGRVNTVLSAWLQSKQQIIPENVSKALWIVSRQVPHLQFCCMKNGRNYWLKRMAKLEIDFETSSKEPMEIHEEMLATVFDIWKGPLWKVRLNVSISDSNSKSNKFSSYLSLCVHHAITDGTTNMKIYRDLIFILNKMSAGEDVVPTFSPVCPTMDVVTQGMYSRAYFAKLLLRTILSKVIRNFGVQSSFNGALPITNPKSTNRKFIFHDFTKCETDTILKLCKEAEITVNSFITTVSNFALMAVAQSKSKTPIGPREMVTLQTINMRRYYEPEYKDSSGCHFICMDDISQIALSEAKDFWSVAKKTNHNIRNKIEISKEPVQNIPFISYQYKTVPVNYFLTSKGFKNRTNCHFVMTNMGNLTKLLHIPKEEDDIEITYFLRSLHLSYCGNPFYLVFHTFNDKLQISVDYSLNLMEDEIARAFMDRLIQHIRDLVNNKSIC